MSALRVKSGTAATKNTAQSGSRGSLRQQAPASLDKDPRTYDDVGITSVFAPVMADTADRGHEHHAGRHDGGENLGVMAGGTRHAERLAVRKGGAGRFNRILECGIHHGGRPGTKPLHHG